MADISAQIRTIQQAARGEEVRDALVSSLTAMNNSIPTSVQAAVTAAVESGDFTGPQGETGADGVSPAVTVTTITGGHRVTITDREHPNGQNFDVLDGSGDMTGAVYDPNGTVASAGGIAAYVAAQIALITDANGVSY